MTARLTSPLLLLTAVAMAVPAAAQTLQYEVAAGYQWLEVMGNDELFRTQTGEKDGFRLDALNLLVVDTKGALAFDRLRVTAAGLGASPDSRLSLQASRAGVYTLRLAWSRADVFSALPGYANPLQERGVFPGQHTLDRRRQSLDLDLELLPGRTVTPLVGYSRSTYRGGARTTYHFGQDEFLLTSNLDEAVNEYRLGVGFAVGDFRGAVIQGWRSLESTNTMALAAGAGAGNNLRPLLGRDIDASRLDLRSRTEVDTPFTSAHVTGHLWERVRVVGTYSRADADSEGNDSGDMAGRFASFALQRFFARAEERAAGKASQLNWRGEGRVEVDIAPWLDASLAYRSNHRELDGHAFVTTKYFETVNFSGAFPGDLSTVLGADTAWERDESVAEAKLIARPLPWLRAWASTATVDQKITIVPALAEIVVPGGQGGSFRRDLDRLAGGAVVRLGVLSVGGDWTREEADRVVVRTDFTERKRLRGHLTLQLADKLRATATAEKIESSNPDPAIDYAAEVKHWAASVEVTPIPPLTVRAGYDSFRSDSTLRILKPQELRPDLSLYAEDGESLEASAQARVSGFALEVGVNRYRNRGSFPFDLKRFFTRFEVDLTQQLGVYAQLEQREYEESPLPQAYFDADRYGLFLRWTGK